MRLNLPKLKTLAVVMPLLMASCLGKGDEPIDTLYYGPDSDVYIRMYRVKPSAQEMAIWGQSDWWNWCASPQLHYRFRYLNKKYYPEDGSFLTVAFDKNKGITMRPLDVPKEEGDVEFFLTYYNNAPYYVYTDYSGAKTPEGNAPNLGGLYSEKINFVTNRSASATSYQTMGRDWYVRIRRGKTNTRAIKIKVTEN